MNCLIKAFQQSQRSISTSTILNGKKNFRKFLLYNKRGTRDFKKDRHITNPDMPLDLRGVRETGIRLSNGQFQVIPEMVPELIVPDLTDCQFKPYVTYKTKDVIQSEFLSQDLFNAIYAQKIIQDFKEGKLLEDGSSKNPSENELLTKEEAWIRAKKTGTDLY